MRELHGMVFHIPSEQFLKSKMMLFDSIHTVGRGFPDPMDGHLHETDLWDSLESVGIIRSALPRRSLLATMSQAMTFGQGTNSELTDDGCDFMTRIAVDRYLDADIPRVAICKKPLPASLSKEEELLFQQTSASSTETTLRIASQMLPTPDDSSAWDDILNFKAELHDKQWTFRRFLATLATKHQTEAEVHDEIDWMLNEYSNAMKIHHIKASQSFFEVYLLPAIEIAENLAKFNWSKIAKGALDVKKRKVELLEAEMKAPGRECAYVFDAQKRFGG